MDDVMLQLLAAKCAAKAMRGERELIIDRDALEAVLLAFGRVVNRKKSDTGPTASAYDALYR